MSRPTTFVQVHSFYPAYLEKFYASRPSLGDRPVREQIRAMVDDGYSGTHLLGRYLEPLGYECELIVGNCPQAQARWLAEHGMGDRTPASPMEMLALQLETLAPDVVYFTDSVLFHDGLVGSLARRPGLVIGWRAAHVPQAIRWTQYDVLLSCLSGIRAAALEQGARAAEPFAPGFPDHVAAAIPFPQAKDVDITFLGHYTTGIHPDRNRLLEVVAATASRLGATCRLHLSGDLHAVPAAVKAHQAPPLFGMDMYRAIARSRLCFDARGNIWLRDGHARMVRDLAGNETANMRLFEGAGCGSLVLTQQRDNLKEFFCPDAEMATYGNDRELEERIESLLARPDETSAMAARARQRCLRDHAMSCRARQFDEMLRRHWPNRR